MLGSHFDLAREIKAIAARRGVDTKKPAKREKTNPAFEDFDRRISAFLDSVAPIRVDDESRQDFGTHRSPDDRG